MKHEIEQIRNLCNKYKTEPKVLIIPSDSMKTQVLKTLADYGVRSLNLEVKSIRRLCFDIAENSIIEDDLKVIDNREVVDAMTDAVRALQKKGALRFFNDIEITIGICKSITRTVLELLSCGYLQGSVSLDKVENKNKRHDIETIIKDYTAWKKETGYIDYTDVAQIALSITEKSTLNYAAGYTLQACELDTTEEKIIKNLNIQKADFETSKDPTLNAKSVKFIKAYGDYNEVKEMLRLIIGGNIPFDNVLIAATSEEPYSQLLYQLITQYVYENEQLPAPRELPVTFGSGLPIMLSTSAQLLELLLAWIDSDYRSEMLINIFSSGTFDIKVDQQDDDGELLPRGERFSRLGVINIIKRSGIIWQRRSYIPCLKKHLSYLEEKSGADSKSIKATKWLMEFIKTAFEIIPHKDENGLIDVEKLLGALKIIISKYKQIYSPLDSIGAVITLQELETSIKGRQLRLDEATQIIIEHMKDVRIMPEPPAPGRMHFTTYKKAAWIERKHTFILGLGANNFPGMALEDPLLLDNERVAPPMIISTDRINKNIETMSAFIENISNNLTCSYSCFDTIDIRDSFPATLFNKIKEKCPNEEIRNIDFALENTDMLIDDTDYWSYYGAKAAKSLQGVESEEETETEPVWQSATDIPTLDLTATSLTTFAKCKYKYFLKHVLRLKEVRDEEFDPLGWMSSLDTGNVYHKIFENFVKHEIENPGILQDRDNAVEYMRNLAEKEIAAFEEILPTASAYFTELQCDDIYRNAEIFVDYEIDQANARKAEYAELRFGETSPVVIDIGENRHLQIKGQIDRIDRLEDGSIEIIDYKSGGTYDYRDLRSPQEEDIGIDEANAQLTVYFLALKQLAQNGDTTLPKNIGDISKMSYRFVTAKGEYEVISMPTDDDAVEPFKEALLEICKEIEKGEFTPEKGKIHLTEKDKDKREAYCKFCGYNTACKYAR